MPKKSSTEMEVVVTLDESHFSQIKEVAEQLSAMGLRNINALESIGAITGRVSSGLLGKLQSVPGISAIEASGSVHITPPESNVQ